MKNYLLLLFVFTIVLTGCNGSGMKHDSTMMESKSESMGHDSMMDKSHMKKDEMKKDSM